MKTIAELSNKQKAKLHELVNTGSKYRIEQFASDNELAITDELYTYQWGKRKLTSDELQRLNNVKAPTDVIDRNSFDRALWIMQETGYFDDANNGRFSVYYSPSSTEVRYINSICLMIGFNRKGLD